MCCGGPGDCPRIDARASEEVVVDPDAIGAGSNCCSQHVASERTNLRAHDCAFGHSCGPGPDPDSMEAERTAVVEPG